MSAAEIENYMVSLEHSSSGFRYIKKANKRWTQGHVPQEYTVKGMQVKSESIWR